MEEKAKEFFISPMEIYTLDHGLIMIRVDLVDSFLYKVIKFSNFTLVISKIHFILDLVAIVIKQSTISASGKKINMKDTEKYTPLKENSKRVDYSKKTN